MHADGCALLLSALTNSRGSSSVAAVGAAVPIGTANMNVHTVPTVWSRLQYLDVSRHALRNRGCLTVIAALPDLTELRCCSDTSILTECLIHTHTHNNTVHACV